ncbi:MAG: beta-ketoacyl-ACP synthase II [Anaerolineales bacterium]|nr:beta-ketoacyl-ACP synthase II [Anaerolineales bacterium]
MQPVPSPARRVVVTGLGLISPVGLTVEEAWRNVLAGCSGIRTITLFDTEKFRVKIAGEAWGFDPLNYMGPKEARRADRNVQFAIAAAQEALGQARLNIEASNANEVGVLIGSGAAGIHTYTAQQKVMDVHGPSRLSPLLIPMITVDAASVQVSIFTGARGPNFGVAAACSTGAVAIGEAFEIIRRGDAEVMITGGTEAAVTPLGIAGFDQMNALSRRNDDPTGASRPFDKTRDGFVLSEGAGVLVLESLAHARARGAEPLAEVLAYANTSDALHFTNPDPEGQQAARAISHVIRKAGCRPEDVDHINAHAASTPLGDVFEVRAIKHALGKHAARVPVSATKSVTGHMLGAAGAVEAIFTILSLRDQVLPPTINYRTPDPECDLDCVPNTARPAQLRVALTTAFGFGGHNTVLALRRWEPGDEAA